MKGGSGTRALTTFHRSGVVLEAALADAALAGARIDEPDFAASEARFYDTNERVPSPNSIASPRPNG